MQPLPAIPDVPQIPATLTDGVQALLTHNWYAGAAIGLMIFIQVVKKYELLWWSKTPLGFKFVWPIALAMLAAFVHGYAAGETLHASLMDTLNAIWQIAFPAMGGAAALKNSPLPWSGGAGGIPKPPPPPDLDAITIPSPPPPLPADLHLVPPLEAAPEHDEDDRKTPLDPPPVA